MRCSTKKRRPAFAELGLKKGERRMDGLFRTSVLWVRTIEAMHILVHQGPEAAPKSFALGPRPSALIFARTGTGDFVSRQALREKHVQERLQKFSQPGSLRSLGLGKDAKLRIGWTSCVYIWCRQEMTLDT